MLPNSSLFLKGRSLLLIQGHAFSARLSLSNCLSSDSQCKVSEALATQCREPSATLESNLHLDAGKEEISIVASIVHERLIGVDTHTRLNIAVEGANVRKQIVPQPLKSFQPLKVSNISERPKSPVKASEGYNNGALIMLEV